MGRRAEGWKLRWKRGYAYVRFTFDGRQFTLALRTQVPAEADARAAQAYAETVSGRRRAIARRPGVPLAMEQLYAEFLAAHEGTYDRTTIPTLEGYGRRFVAFFRTLDRVTEAAIGDYSRQRLREVMKKTLYKERSALRVFLTWLHEQGSLPAVPAFPRLPSKATGVRSGTQRQTRVDVTAAEARAIVALLPEETRTRKGRKWPVRARFAFQNATGLRPGTLEVLSVPEHWRPGLAFLEVPNEDDKGRFGRRVPLSAEAVAILRTVAPISGLIFGRFDLRVALKKAATAILGPERGAKFAPYDFRHRLGTAVTGSDGLLAAAYLLGHKRVDTTAAFYAHPGFEAAQAAVSRTIPGPESWELRAKEGT